MNARTPLFREEAIQARQRTWLGEVVVVSRPSFGLCALFSLAFIATLALLLSLGSYTRRSTVHGHLAPDKGLIKIYPPAAAVVLEQRVREGSAVAAGDILFTLSADLGSEAHRDMRAGIGQEMARRLESLQSELDALPRQQDEETRMLAQKIAAAGDELAALQSQLQAQSARQALAAGNLARYRDLQDRHFISHEMLQQKRMELLEQDGKADELRRARIVLQDSLAARRGELQALPQKQRNQREQLERQLSGARQEILENESRRRLAVTAPQAGTVTTAIAQAGQAVERNMPMLSLIPAGALLQAELYVPSAAAGFIRVGQQVALRYQAYPYQKFGRALGRVQSISLTALPAAELRLPFSPAATGKAQSGEPFYRVIAALPAQALDGHALQVGMLLEADILLDSRKLYEWLLEPLYGISRRL